VTPVGEAKPSGRLPVIEERCILYIVDRRMMKRTQLYLDEKMAKTLAALSRQRGTTVSRLVRESVEEKYMVRKEMDKASLARQLSGIWGRRKDLKHIDRYLRRLRKGARGRTLGRG
jgi:predicted DNA-binding protein